MDFSRQGYRDVPVTVFGFGRSGIASARRLVSLGAGVLISEERPKESFDGGNTKEMDRLGIETEFGGHTEKCLQDAGLIILSPGVHLDIPILKEARERKIKIISEVEFAFSLLGKPIIAVTGTNGKTTTTMLIGDMLKAARKRVAVAGNIGHPLSAVDDSKLDFTVAEISSYQLETIENFKPFVSVILNITEDHLERHKTMEEYVRLKGRIFLNQGTGDYLVFNADDPLVAELSKSSKTVLIPFSRQKVFDRGVFVRGEELVRSLDRGREVIIKKDDMFIKGDHNVENALAAAAAASVAGADVKSISNTLKNFKGVSHRIEYVATLSGVSFYNDSKGTNPDSTIVALKALKDNVVLIAGGRDKGGDLSKLVDEAKRRVKAIVLIGEARERFEKNFRGSNYNSVYEAGTMEDAVEKAYGLSRSGDKVLLSPACASFDMFRDYEDRGDSFKTIVRALK